MTHPDKRSEKYYMDKLQVLIGGRLIATQMDDEGYICLVFRVGSPSRDIALWLMSDDEGNHPGTFDIVDPASKVAR